jgi:2-polyprenyl-3-methyl-5-hydroxy-6-metoxy-1,4-benzoquinol methylase
VETVDCNLCGSRDHRLAYSMPDVHFHRDRWFDIVECSSCGLGFVNPRPSFEEMREYYPRQFYNYFDDASLHSLRYEREAEFLDAPGNGKMLLDIGCANGDFPRFMMNRGWKVEGVEVSTNARPISDFTVYRQDFASLPFDSPRYDAITAWAVLEHVHDPAAYFRKAATLLKPGGRFVFLVTNFSSSSSRFLFREDPPRHLYFFAENTVAHYLKRVGLRLERAIHNDRINTMRPVSWLRRLLITTFLRRPLRFQDIPENRVEYLSRRGFANNPIGNLRYLVTHPLTIFDRLSMPVYEKIQLMSRSYGITTYVATRPD